MKRLIVFSALLIGLFASCTKDEILVPEKEEPKRDSTTVEIWEETDTTVIIISDY